MNKLCNILCAITFLVFVDIPFALGVNQLLAEFGLSGAVGLIVRFLLVVMVNLKISYMWKY